MNDFVGEQVINIDLLSTFLQKEKYERDQLRSSQIHKIHWSIPDKDKKDYEPSHVSIGPHHRGNPALSAMEKVKWAYLNYLLELNPEKNLHDYIQAVGGLEKQARSCYADEIKMDKKIFVEMLLLDACFLLMTLNGTDQIAGNLMTSIEGTEIIMDANQDQWVIDVDPNRQSIQTNQYQVNDDEDNSHGIYDPVFTKILLRDLLLLENQIPFFVVKKIYEIATGGRSPVSLLVNNVVESMKDMFGCHPEAIQMYQSKEIYHLLHLCHMYFKPNVRGEENCPNYVMRVAEDKNQGQPPSHWRQATQYLEARIELKERKLCSANPHSLLDIRFTNGTLEIPCLDMEPEIFSLFKNLIAFEKICPQFGNYVTSYGVFWSQLNTKPDDTALLIEKGIIRTGWNRDNEVADLFRSLTDCVVLELNSDNYLNSLLHMMEAHYQIRRPRWKELFGSIKSKVWNWTALYVN